MHRAFLKSICLVAALTACLGVPALAEAQSRTELAVGGGLILFIPFAHMELRHYPSENVSIAAFASATHATGTFTFGEAQSRYNFLLTNIGAEMRYHLAPRSVVDPHLGFGGGVLVGDSNHEISTIPWGWANVGLTVPVSEHVRLDLELNPVLGLPQSDSGLTAIPVARVRWVF